MKVGILGGTFDPIHNAHIEIAKAALNQFSLDKVMVIAIWKYWIFRLWN